jgi:beta-glucosidase
VTSIAKPLVRCSLLAAGLTLFLTACSTPDTAQTAAPVIEQKRQPELWPKVKTPFPATETAAINAEVEKLLARMTLAQKVGQITQAEISRTTPDDVKRYHLGSVLNGGGGFLDGNKQAPIQDWIKALDAYYEASMDTSDGRLPIPITWGTDAVHGHNKIVGATIFPHNIGLGATRNGELVRRIGEITAVQVRASGMDWTFSPSLSVVRNDRWGRTYEGFSEDPKLVSELGRQAILGYQGDLSKTGRMDPSHIMATAKHYLADGGTVDGIDRGNNFSSEEELIRLHAYPYFAAVEAGVLSVMASHSSWHGTRMHGEQYLLTEVLKNRLGFDGFVVGDWNSHGLVEGCTNTRCPQSINAGVDMLMVPFDWKEFIENTIADVEAGHISMARLDDAVRRILRAKFRAGLMDGRKPSERLHANKAELLAAPEFKEVARQAVRESLVLLKNNGQTLPLKPKLNVLVAGKGAHNLAQQSGGWTISWQATDITNEDFPNGTSIYDGIRHTVEAAGGKVELSVDGKYKRKPDVAIVVYGETPYAEWQGDIRHMGYQTGGHQDAKLLEKLKADGIKTVSVFISGRPLWVNRALNASDAFVAAWLPGSEGAGIADVLFADANGKVRYDFKGKLAFSWPKSLDQTEVNIGDANYDPLFPFDYGLTYADNTTVPALPTEENFENVKGGADEELFVGTAQAPWQVYAMAPDTTPVRYLSGIAKNASLTLTEGDKETQGDAIHATWDGRSTSTLQIIVPNAMRDLSQVLEEKGALVFDIRLLQASSAPVKLQMACLGAGCEAEIDLTTLVNASPRNDWNELSVDLACFAKQGIRFHEVTRGFALETSGKLELQVTNIRMVPGMGDKAGAQCQ